MNRRIMSMAEPSFKVLAGPGDWGSPLSEQPSFKTMEEAQAAAREYLRAQRAGGSLGVPERVFVEETRRDGSVANHRVA